MEQVISNTGHDDMIHDAVLDYYGRRLATCSSDRTIKIFDIEGETHRLVETLRGHEGAVWCVAWAHPKYGNILASSGYDGKVLIWREQNGQWQKIFEFALHTASVNAVSWSPHEAGCLLACASSDGNVSVLEFDDNRWEHKIFPAHGIGVNAVSWAPANYPGALFSSGRAAQTRVRRFVTGGSDNLVKIWDWNPELKSYSTTLTLTGHTDWVRDVAWAPTILQKSYIASASQDKTVRIWTCSATSASAGAGGGDDSAANNAVNNAGADHSGATPGTGVGGGGGGAEGGGGAAGSGGGVGADGSAGDGGAAAAAATAAAAGGSGAGAGGAGGGKGEAWHSSVLHFDARTWRVSWSFSGNVLAVSGGDNKVTLWKENLRGEWDRVKTIEE